MKGRVPGSWERTPGLVLVKDHCDIRKHRSHILLIVSNTRFKQLIYSFLDLKRVFRFNFSRLEPGVIGPPVEGPKSYSTGYPYRNKRTPGSRSVCHYYTKSHSRNQDVDIESGVSSISDLCRSVYRSIRTHSMRLFLRPTPLGPLEGPHRHQTRDSR